MLRFPVNCSFQLLKIPPYSPRGTSSWKIQLHSGKESQFVPGLTYLGWPIFLNKYLWSSNRIIFISLTKWCNHKIQDIEDKQFSSYISWTYLQERKAQTWNKDVQLLFCLFTPLYASYCLENCWINLRKFSLSGSVRFFKGCWYFIFYTLYTSKDPKFWEGSKLKLMYMIIVHCSERLATIGGSGSALPSL